jgi:hypothetical protein
MSGIAFELTATTMRTAELTYAVSGTTNPHTTVYGTGTGLFAS